MKRRLFPVFLVALLLCQAVAAYAGTFSFAVAAHTVRAAGDDAPLREAIEQTDAENLAFVVVNGLKAADEPCNDALYGERKGLLQEAKNGVVVSLAASDWIACADTSHAGSIGHLARLRELLFGDEYSLGGTRLPLVRQSAVPKFRLYAENARWEVDKLMFATLNLPVPNNHYLTAAGRNSEFEDRLVANREWLHRLFVVAAHRKLKGIVLFCDGNPLRNGAAAGRDGYAEIRHQLITLASRYAGKVLVVHSAPVNAASVIEWRNGAGELGISPGWTKVRVNTASPDLFTLDAASSGSSKTR